MVVGCHLRSLLDPDHSHLVGSRQLDGEAEWTGRLWWMLDGAGRSRDTRLRGPMDAAHPSIDVLGIPIPTSDPVFLGVLAVHVALALVALVAGGVAAMSRKGPGRHPTAGTVYLGSLVGVVATAGVLTVFRPREDWPLLALGLASVGCAFYGRAQRREALPDWRRRHLVAMGSSFVLMLTAFYVDNGPHLAVWRALPSWTFWVIPPAVGVPLILRGLNRNPRTQQPDP
jgi:hypothetical protein